ncbi:SulP family inorganic anion transporter, partial [Hominenteromicrobium sp.]|uniref:SulP family inorganic anion transporter n=1 Tax=Hominenteromicrobium sp. TaxID=3073581 RepID=UPI003AF1DE4D
MAGLTVCAVALPLALAFGVSSGATAAAGLVTAIIAGVVIAVLGGASFQISGPTGAMSAVLVGIVASYGLQGVFFACFAAGALLLLAGIFKLGRLISFIPMPVIMGFTSGIAIIIALGQIDNFFGTTSEGLTNIEKLLSYGRLGFHVNWQAALIGLLVVAVMVVWPKQRRARVPGSLVGIIAAAIVSGVFQMDSRATVVDSPRTLRLADRLDLSSLSFSMVKDLLSPIVTIAALGMIEIGRRGRLATYRRAPMRQTGTGDALDFFSEAAPCGVVGSYLLDRLPEHESPFVFKHHYMTAALDSEILCTLFLAMRDKR